MKSIFSGIILLCIVIFIEKYDNRAIIVENNKDKFVVTTLTKTNNNSTFLMLKRKNEKIPDVVWTTFDNSVILKNQEVIVCDFERSVNKYGRVSYNIKNITKIPNTKKKIVSTKKKRT